MQTAMYGPKTAVRLPTSVVSRFPGTHKISQRLHFAPVRHYIRMPRPTLTKAEVVERAREKQLILVPNCRTTERSIGHDAIGTCNVVFGSGTELHSFLCA